jgi:hypothetical protein
MTRTSEPRDTKDERDQTMNATKTSPKNAANEFAALCRDGGWKIRIKTDTVVSISKSFAPNDREAFLDCDMDYHHILTTLPHRGGSMWGTDGGSVGGYVALTNGHFEMNLSGVSKVAIRELGKIA